ncbi:FAD-dependent thymidylate synthase [Streptomyces sp. NPDC059874]|uniref:FAD-dependent thymidylate synthase n=1 Tax=Streptomyces sp. NPDC059874 TaxID=3346983 RepID=UPI0036571933
MKNRSDITVQLVNVNALDEHVVQAARVSTQGSDSITSTGSPAGLINFLMRDRHGSPFEHTSFTFLVEAPVFVAREHMRHRAGWSYNEESGRYKELEGVFYIPSLSRPLLQRGKPGAYEFVSGSDTHFSRMVADLFYAYGASYDAYKDMLKAGIAREIARCALPVGLFTSYYATCNARSLMHFLSLRTRSADATYPSFPQREIELVAEQMEKTFQAHMPSTHAAFVEHGRVAP